MAFALKWAMAPFRLLFGRGPKSATPEILPADPAWTAPPAEPVDGHLPAEEFVLVERITRLMTLDEIERHLPDILGRALARGWIDKPFQAAFMDDPKQMLSTYDVHLPDAVEIEVEAEPGKRPRIVVYQVSLGGRKRRLLYLQLVMMAGR
ncbi:hypothetical protein [Donghicola sp. XS_ASV15]|uniref:hypothetical protein n=1 Tax=Donghicola sp. XS_ASV15 TaxID=3241295 RepID=UPI0035153710